MKSKKAAGSAGTGGVHAELILLLESGG